MTKINLDKLVEGIKRSAIGRDENEIREAGNILSENIELIKRSLEQIEPISKESLEELVTNSFGNFYRKVRGIYDGDVEYTASQYVGHIEFLNNISKSKQELKEQFEQSRDYVWLFPGYMYNLDDNPETKGGIKVHFGFGPTTRDDKAKDETIRVYQNIIKVLQGIVAAGFPVGAKFEAERFMKLPKSEDSIGKTITIYIPRGTPPSVIGYILVRLDEIIEKDIKNNWLLQIERPSPRYNIPVGLEKNLAVRASYKFSPRTPEEWNRYIKERISDQWEVAKKLGLDKDIVDAYRYYVIYKIVRRDGVLSRGDLIKELQRGNYKGLIGKFVVVPFKKDSNDISYLPLKIASVKNGREIIVSIPTEFIGAYMRLYGLSRDQINRLENSNITVENVSRHSWYNLVFRSN